MVGSSVEDLSDIVAGQVAKLTLSAADQYFVSVDDVKLYNGQGVG